MTGLVGGQSGCWEVSTGSRARGSGTLARGAEASPLIGTPVAYYRTGSVGGWALEVSEKTSFLNLFSLMEEASYD